MVFKINDKVIFKWNNAEFSCIIEEVLDFIEVYNTRLYIVRFPPNSYAGSHENPRKILEYYLKLDPNYENNIHIEIMNNRRFVIEI
jgi:hypothetical protein